MYFHCSKEVFKPYNYLEPRVPKNRMNTEDGETKRICVSKSIDGCLCAIGGFEIGDIVNVYHVFGCNEVVSPTPKQVEDVMFTGEEWMLDLVQVTRQYKIRITNVFVRVHNTMSIDLYDYEFI